MRWTLDDIGWHRFDATKLDKGLVALVKAASLVEANAADYVTYLRNVFADDPAFIAAAERWGTEEAQHGAALGRWAMLADPDFDFERALAWFREGFRLPLDADRSVRGSRAGELIARQVVESGTSSFYCAIRDATEEPVLRQICHRIATDEFAHYRLFAQHAQRYLAASDLGRLARLKIAFGRVQETEDDELAYAFYAANVKGRPDAEAYDMTKHALAYWRCAFAVYQPQHIDNATRMILRAATINPHGILAAMVSRLFWAVIRVRRGQLARAA
ncbi:MAG: ferritin-like domain-containing protein [Alphaproteobacteria bacterium]|nr:MAG: ferritin-like domain-containing protein [Alphaproteobacteria bacterium]